MKPTIKKISKTKAKCMSSKHASSNFHSKNSTSGFKPVSDEFDSPKQDSVQENYNFKTKFTKSFREFKADKSRNENS